MARVKNMVRNKMASPGASKTETRLPRAMFSGSAVGGRTVSCSECGLTLRNGNLARHKRVKHSHLKLPVERLVSTQPVSEKLIVKLPIRKAARKGSVIEDEHRGLMATPQSVDELNLGLAKLYAAQVPKPRVTGLSYELTRTLVAMTDQRAERA